MSIVIYDRIYIPKKYVNTTKAKSLFTYMIEYFNGVQKLTTYKILGDYFVIPYGAEEKLPQIVKGKPPIENKLVDVPANFPDHVITLREDQEVVIKDFLAGFRTTGFIHSRPGSGKTVMATYLLPKLGQKFLIIVPTSLLLDQWVDRLTTFIPGIKVGVLGLGRDTYDESCHGMVAIVNTLTRRIDDYRKEVKFGTIVMDEAHRLPAETFKNTINLIPARYKIGLSANTTRKDKKHVVIQDYLGTFCVVNENPDVRKASIVVVNTGFNYVFTPNMRWTNFLNKVCFDSDYNQKIAQKVIQNIRQGRRIAVLSPRLGQLEQIAEYLQGYSVGVITGSVPQAERMELMDKVNKGEIDVLLCSKQIFEEGADIQALDTLHLVAPSNNIEKLMQAIGRVEREFPGKKKPIVYDYWFMAPTKNTLHKQQRERYEYYESQGYEITQERL